MNRKRYVEGELYLSLETVAELYEVQVVWLREVYDLGLLGKGFAEGPTLCIAAIQMDRVATIVRLNRVLGLDLHAVMLALESEDPESENRGIEPAPGA